MRNRTTATIDQSWRSFGPSSKRGSPLERISSLVVRLTRFRTATEERVWCGRRCQAVAMVLEHAPLQVIPGSEQDFERAFEEASKIISGVPGFRSLRLGRCVGARSRYLLLVEWDRIEDHTERFRRSAEYERWKALLHHFYEPFPTVEHFEPLLEL
jgi:heme-degrading monooxygenase HmoA